MIRIRLHWFWRGSIAVLIGFGASAATSAIVWNLLGPTNAPPSVFVLVPMTVIPWTAPLIIYGLLTLCFGPKHVADEETRCRQCGYILRGISEPRCSECGERI